MRVSVGPEGKRMHSNGRLDRTRGFHVNGRVSGNLASCAQQVHARRLWLTGKQKEI